jgi:hypothetical protein
MLVSVFAGYLMVRARILGAVATRDVAPFIDGLDTGTRITTAIANWGEYLRLLVYPSDLVVEYAPAVIVATTAADPRFWVGIAVGIGALAVTCWTWRSQPLIAMGITWFAVSIAPTSNLVVPIATWLAERFLYLPSVGFSLLVAGTFAVLLERVRAWRWSLVALTIAALVPMTIRTWTRNATWQDSETVAQTLLREHPESYRVQWLRAVALWRLERWDDALQAVNAAIAANPYMPEMQQQRAIWLRKRARALEPERGAEGNPDRLPTGRSRR